MKILAVSHEFPPIGGGGANACYYLTRGLADKGHQVTLITVCFRESPKQEIVDGVRVIRVKARRKYKEHCSLGEMFSYLISAIKAADRLQREEAQDICLVFFGIPSGPIGYYLKKKYRIPYVIRFGGGDIPGFQERYKGVYRWIAPFVRMIWKNAEELVANSQGLKELALQFYGKKHIQVICNGVDTEKYCPKQREDDGVFRILFVSRLIERKGLQFIIPQLKEIKANCGKKIRLIVVGDGPYRKGLEELTCRYKAQDVVEFVGQADKDGVASYYQNADVFILPSQKEGMPNVVLEAMACGLPVIMTPCQGSEELVHGNGFICTKEEFGEKICEMAKDDDLRHRFGRESRKIVEKQFIWSNILDQYLGLL